MKTLIVKSNQILFTLCYDGELEVWIWNND